MSERAVNISASASEPQRSRVGRTAYCERGVGEPIVFIHGVGMNCAAWGPQIDAFARTHRVVALDILGHGQSAAPPAAAALDDYLTQLIELLDALDLATVNIVGHSMGALVAIAFALAHPRRTLRLAALNGVYDRDAQSRAAVHARAREIASGRAAGDVDTPIRRWFGDNPQGPEAAAATRVRRWLHQVDGIGYACAYRVFAESGDDFVGRLGELRAPALFLTGDLDPNSTAQMSERMAGAAPRGRARILRGQRHMLNLVDPAATNAALWELMAESIPERLEENS